MKQGLPVSQIRSSWGADDRPLFVLTAMFDYEEGVRRQMVAIWVIQLLRLNYICRFVQIRGKGRALVIAAREVPDGHTAAIFADLIAGGAPCILDTWTMWQTGQSFLDLYVREGWASTKE